MEELDLSCEELTTILDAAKRLPEDQAKQVLENYIQLKRVSKKLSDLLFAEYKDYSKGILQTIKNVCVMRFDKPTINGRRYTASCIDLEDPTIKERLATHTLFGRLGYADSDKIDISKVAFAVSDLRKTEDGLYADFDILDTPQGRILCTLLKRGMNLNVGPAGTGDCDWDGTVSNYNLGYFAAVETPVYPDKDQKNDKQN